MSYQEEWERKKEERQRKRLEMNGEVTNGSASPTTKTSSVTIPGVQLKQTPKSPTMVNHGEKQLNEAEKKAEELRQKREQERVEAEQRTYQELTKTTVTMTPERKEEIRRAREERERQEKQEEEERKARAENLLAAAGDDLDDDIIFGEELSLLKICEKVQEETRKMREDIQRRRQEAEAKRKKAAEENQTAYSIPKYNLAESIAKAKQEKMQSSAEMMAEREKRIEENFPQIRISARDSEERLREIAEILHAKLVEVYGDIYDLEQRKERQEYDVNEMNARIKDLTKNKTVTVTLVDHGHVSMLKEKGFTFEDKTAKQKQTVDLTASLPSSGNIADKLQQLQNNLKKDAETPEKAQKKGPISIKPTYSTPEQLKEELEASKREAEKFRQQREENRKKREAEIRKIEEFEKERLKKEEEERKKQAEERERLKKEKEVKEKMKKSMMSPAGAPINISKVVSQQKAKNREETIADRVPTVTISSTTTEVELRNFANDLYNKLKTTMGDIFDLNEKQKKNEYYLKELNERVGVIKVNKSSPIVSTGIVSKMKDGGAWTPKKQNDVGRASKPRELGGIASEGGVRGRLAMFSGGGGDSTDSPPKKTPPAKINIYK